MAFEIDPVRTQYQQMQQQVQQRMQQATRLPTPARPLTNAPVSPVLAQQRQQLMASTTRPRPTAPVQGVQDVQRLRQQDAIQRMSGLRGFRAPLMG